MRSNCERAILRHNLSTNQPFLSPVDSTSFSRGGDFDIRLLPLGREFEIATTCFGQKAVPTGGNLTFSRSPGVGNLTLALVKMSNSSGSDHPSPHPGVNIDGYMK